MIRHRLRLAFFCCACALTLFVQPAVPAQATRRATTTRVPTPVVASIPSPASVLGFAPGDDRTLADWRQITDYFTRLDRASERVLVSTLGETTLRRPLIVAFISAPENIHDLARLQAAQQRLADPRLVRDEAERERLVRDGKTIVAISCSIHSTEIVASQMSMQLAYELASAQDEETREILRNTVLLLIPSANPDGVDIVADWYRKTLGTPYEGTEPPELYHHYAGHDDNRDWFMLNLKETKLITSLFWQQWFPQIVYDVHQQGATGSRFFIPPFFDPPNPRIAPLLLREVGLLGHKIAADLQAAGQQGVITNAMYDTWWHGGFRTAPYFHNSIGILSEAASAKLMTPITVTREQLALSATRGMASALQNATNFPDPWLGGLWRPRDIMRVELSAARSVLSLAAKYRARYLQNFYELGRAAIAPITNLKETVAYVIPPGQGRDENIAKLVGVLIGQGVEVYRLEKERVYIVPLGVAKGSRKEVPAGSYVVFLEQPQRANVLALFEQQVYPDRRTASGEAERPYDVAGWTLPLQMGVTATPIPRPLFNTAELDSPPPYTRVHDENEVRHDLGLSLQAGDKSPVANPVKPGVRLALYQSWTSSMDEGWTRYVFDTLNVPFQTLRDADVRAGNLRARYDVIVLPSMRSKEIVEGNEAGKYPAKYTGGITEAGVENLRRFVEAGGTLICFDASAELAIKRFGLPLRNVLEGVKSSQFYCPGSILRLNVATDDRLARGFTSDVDAYFINSSAYELTAPADPRVRVVARYAERDVLRSGWLLGEKYLAGKVALAEVRQGQGRVVLFAFRPQHRGQTWGTFPFIWNALNEAADVKR